jgi:hypothetical protein
MLRGSGVIGHRGSPWGEAASLRTRRGKGGSPSPVAISWRHADIEENQLCKVVVSGLLIMFATCAGEVDEAIATKDSNYDRFNSALTSRLYWVEGRWNLISTLQRLNA